MKLSRKATEHCSKLHLYQGSQTHGPREFCAADVAFWEFLNNSQLSYLVYLLVFKSVRPVSEEVPFKQRWSKLEMISLQSMTPFAGNKM